MLPDDPVRAYLRRKGCPMEVVSGGLRGLVESWDRFTREAAEGRFEGPTEDYLREADRRQFLEEVLPLAPEGHREPALARVRDADERLRRVLRPAGGCLWGETVARNKGWRPEREWWYFHLPGPPVAEG